MNEACNAILQFQSAVKNGLAFTVKTYVDGVTFPGKARNQLLSAASCLTSKMPHMDGSKSRNDLTNIGVSLPVIV